ncbi:hypothetical protein COLO4_06778 [Corchorus olitorius]|uniref:Uncharacterized protein n=1 Tax=Corchorus olitorius TaxID=93759 RepID=A0A1R3KLZ0_9ROSI|nr:hypothetical protein COLO4_06778 [Corchorus olitorius]
MKTMGILSNMKRDIAAMVLVIMVLLSSSAAASNSINGTMQQQAFLIDDVVIDDVVMISFADPSMRRLLQSSGHPAIDLSKFGHKMSSLGKSSWERQQQNWLSSATTAGGSFDILRWLTAAVAAVGK